MKLLRAVCTGMALGIVTISAMAAAPVNRNTLIWIQRMNQATKSLNYQGVFFHELRGQAETSQVTHFVDAEGEHEKVLSIKGPEREIIRNNDDAIVYFPQEHLMILDQAYTGHFPNKISFPDILPSLYSIQMGETVTLAGRNVQKMTLEPRDDMRYGRVLWFDSVTGLLLKASMLDEKGNEIAMFGFEQININPTIDRSSLKSQYGVSPDGWTVLNTRGRKLDLGALNWGVRDAPKGFQLSSASLRPIRLNGSDVYHLMLTDGIASVSVFIEPVSSIERRGASSEYSSGSFVSIYKRVVADYQITALGDVPVAALRKIDDGVFSRSK